MCWMEDYGVISVIFGYVFFGYFFFMGVICISINEVVCYGILNLK